MTPLREGFSLEVRFLRLHCDGRPKSNADSKFVSSGQCIGVERRVSRQNGVSVDDVGLAWRSSKSDETAIKIEAKKMTESGNLQLSILP